MATEVDNRVVQMTFNNAQFEKGVDKTLKTIDKLDKALKFQDASEGFDEIQNAANSVSLSKISDQISTLSDKFSGLGIVGMTIWTKIGDAAWDFVTGPFRAVESAISKSIGAVTNQIKTGGWNRAANLEQAKFLIEGLGFAWEKGAGETLEKGGKEVANIYNIVDEAVTGTAYSLDEAAKAAGNLLASGISAEDGGLLGTLNAITGLAATTSSEFSHVADIFSKVAGQGRVMGDDLNRISTLGVNAAAKLAEALETDQATIRDMVSKGQIDFETFAMVMEDAFGEQAQRANDSFTGSMSNVKSALSRIGARIAEPLLNGLIKPLNEVRVLFNEVGKAMDNSGLTQFINDFIGDSSKKLANLFVTFEEDGTIKLKESTQAFFDSLTIWFTGFDRMFKSALKIVRIFGQAFNNVFGSSKSKEYGTGMNKFTEYFDKLNHRLWKDEGLITKIRSAFESFLKVVKVILTVLKAVLNVVAKAVKIFLKLLGVVLKLGFAVASLVSDFLDWFKTTKTYKNIVNAMSKSFNTFMKVLDSVISKIKDGIDKFINFITTSDKVKKVVKGLGDSFKKAGNIFYKTLKIVASAIKDAFSKAVNFVKQNELIRKGIGALADAFSTVKDKAKNTLDFISEKIDNFSFDDFKSDLVEFFTGTLPEKIKEFGDTLVWAFSHPNQCLKLLLEKFGEFKTEVAGKFAGAVDEIGEKFRAFGNKIDESRGKLKDFVNDKSVDPEKAKEKFTIFDVMANALSGLADSLSFLIDVLASAGKGIWDALLTGFATVAKYVDDMTLEEFLDIVSKGIGLFAKIKWAEVASEIAGFFKTIEKSFGGNTLAKTLNSVPRGLLMVAGALALMAMAVKTLGNLDDKQLRKAMSTFFGLAIVIRIIVKAIASLRAAFGELGSSKKKDSEGGEKKQRKGLFGRIADAISNNVGNAGTITAFAIFLGGLGVAIYKVAKAVSLLAKTADEVNDGGKMAGAIVAIAAFLAGITWALSILLNKVSATYDTVQEGEKVTKKGEAINPKTLTGLAAFVFALGTALVEMSAAVLILSAIPLDLLVKGVAALAILGGAIVGLIAIVFHFIKKLQETQQSEGEAIDPNSILYLLLGFAALILVIGLTIKKLAPIMAAMAVVPIGNLLKGVLPIVGIFAVIGLMMWLSEVCAKGVDLKSLAVIFVAIAAIFYIASQAVLDIMSTINEKADYGKLVASVIALVAPMFIAALLVIAVGQLLKKVPDAKGIIQGLAAVIVSAAAAVWAFSTIENWDGVLKGIGAFLLIAVILGVLGLVIGNVPTIQKGLEVLGGVALTIGAGIFLVAVGLAILMALSKDFDKSGKDLVDAIIAIGEALGAALPGLIIGFINGLVDGLARALGESVRVLAQLLLDLLVGIIDFLYENSIIIGAAIGRLFAALAVIIATALVTFVADLWQAFKDAIGWNSPIPGVVDFGVDLIASIIAGLVKKINDLRKWVNERIENVKKVFKEAVNLALETGTLIISKLWEGISNSWEWVSGKIKGIADGIAGFFTDAKDAILGTFDEIFGEGDRVQKQLDETLRKREEAKQAEEAGHRDQTLIDPYADQIAQYKKSIQEANSKITYINDYFRRNPIMSDTIRRDLESSLATQTERLKDAYGALKNVYNEVDYWGEENWNVRGSSRAAAYQLGEWIGTGYKMGIYDSIGGIDYLSGIVGNQVDALKYSLGIASPSKVFIQIGEFMIQGLDKGLTDEFETTDKILTSFAESIASFDTDIESPTITPVLDLTEIQNGANRISAMMSNQKAQVLASMDIKRSDVRNGERLNDLTEAVNHLTIKTDSMDISGELGVQSGLLGQIIDALANQNVVLDSGALVGGITTKMDKALGARSIAVGRRAY